MNAYLMARSAYSSASEQIRTPSDTEYDAFARITSALKKATSPTERAKAIADNRRLWSCLASDVASPGNALPAALRGRIFYLAQFVTHQSRQVLKTHEGMSALIEVNLAIMAGLRRKADAA